MGKESVFLPPPQLYEFSRLRNLLNLEDLERFAQDREQNGLQVTMPVQYRCNDGMTLVLPGDGAYPKEVNYSETPEEADREVAQSLDEFRAKTSNLHRNDIRGPNDMRLHMTIEPVTGHLSANLVSRL